MTDVKSHLVSVHVSFIVVESYRHKATLIGEYTYGTDAFSLLIML